MYRIQGSGSVTPCSCVLFPHVSKDCSASVFRVERSLVNCYSFVYVNFYVFIRSHNDESTFFYLIYVWYILIFSSTSGSPKWSLSLRFLPQHPACTSVLPLVYMLRVALIFLLFCFYYNIWWEVQSTKLLIMLLCRFSCQFLPLRSKWLSQHPILEHPQPTFWQTKFHTHVERGKFMCCIF